MVPVPGSKLRSLYLSVNWGCGVGCSWGETTVSLMVAGRAGRKERMPGGQDGVGRWELAQVGPELIL